MTRATKGSGLFALTPSMSSCLIIVDGDERYMDSGTSLPLNCSFWLFSFRKPAIPAGPLADLPMVRGLRVAVAHAHFSSWSMPLHEAPQP